MKIKIKIKIKILLAIMLLALLTTSSYAVVWRAGLNVGTVVGKGSEMGELGGVGLGLWGVNYWENLGTQYSLDCYFRGSSGIGYDVHGDTVTDGYTDFLMLFPLGLTFQYQIGDVFYLGIGPVICFGYYSVDLSSGVDHVVSAGRGDKYTQPFQRFDQTFGIQEEMGVRLFPEGRIHWTFYLKLFQTFTELSRVGQIVAISVGTGVCYDW
jgi:hypothetical protein